MFIDYCWFAVSNVARGAALLDARVQLDPSELNRSRLNAFLALLA